MVYVNSELLDHTTTNGSPAPYESFNFRLLLQSYEPEPFPLKAIIINIHYPLAYHIPWKKMGNFCNETIENI